MSDSEENISEKDEEEVEEEEPPGEDLDEEVRFKN